MPEDTAGRRWLRRLGWTALAVGAVVLVLAAAVAFVVPGLARREASRGFEAATGRRLDIGGISIHPFVGRVEVRDLAMSEVGGKGTFASFRRLEATVGLLPLLRGNPVISHVRLEGPRFEVIRTAPNTFNFSDLLKYLMLPVPEISLEDVAITGGSIDFTDLALPRPEKHTVRDAELVVPFLTTVPARAAEYGNPRFRAVIDGAPLAVEARVRGLPRAPEASAEVDLEDLSLPVYLSYLPAELPVTVRSGKLAVKGTARYGITEEAGAEVGWDGTVRLTGIEVAEPRGPFRLDVGDVVVRTRVTRGARRGLHLEEGALEVRGLTVPFAGKDGMSVGRLAVEKVTFSEREGRATVGSVILDGGRVRVSRDRRGGLSFEPLARSLEARLPKGKAATPGKPVAYRIALVEGKGIDVSFSDATLAGAPTFALGDVHLSARDVTGPEMGRIPFEAGARWGRSTTIRASGWAVPTPLSADLRVDVQGFPLADGGPFVPPDAGVSIAGGTLDLQVTAALTTRRDRLTGSFGGSLAIRSLQVLDRNRAPLVGWRAFTVDGVKGELEPLRLQVARVGLDGLRAHVILDEKGNSNLPATKDPRLEEGAAGSAARPAAPGGERIRIDEVVMRDGVVDFTDRSVPGPFRASVRDIGVRLTGASNDPGRLADVKVQMTLPKGSSLLLSGKARPLQRPLYAELDVALEGLDLSIATPYSGTFLGLEVDRGALTVKSRARVEQGRLAAENRIRVDQLTFGKAVKSDRATWLPVQLIVDVLRDRDGDIVLDLPVKARTDDENLVGTVIFQAAGEVVFPPGSPVRNVEFEPCSTELSPGAQERLRKLAEVMRERPAMRVTAVGFVDPEPDGAACRAQAAAPSPIPGMSAPGAGQGTRAAPPDDEMLAQLARGRASAVRMYLEAVGEVDRSRVAATTRDVRAAPVQKDGRRARVEFVRGTD